MNVLFSVEVFAGALVSLVVAMIILLVLQVRNSTELNKLTFPAYEYVIKKAEHDADLILAEAQKEARAIIAEAEKSGQKIFSQYEQSAGKAHDTYIGTLENFTKDLTGQLSASVQNGLSHLETVSKAALDGVGAQQASLEKQFGSAFATVERSAEVLETHTAHAVTDMEAHIKKVSEALASKLAHEDKEQKAHITEHLQKIQKNAEEQIAAYQSSRTALLDTHIERLVEDVTRRVLNKQLTLDDHAQLARQALSEAKSHNLL